jgi:hypothetical protein
LNKNLRRQKIQDVRTQFVIVRLWMRGSTAATIAEVIHPIRVRAAFVVVNIHHVQPEVMKKMPGTCMSAPGIV